jgi:Bacterial Ig-like domain (group 1)
MRKLAALIALFGLTLALAGCGGDSGCGALNGGSTSTTTSTSTSTCTGSTGGNTNPTPTAVKVTSSATTIADDGSTTVTFTAVVTNSSGAGISGATVAFTTTAGTLASNSATTSSTGVATTTLTANGVAVGTVITVTGTDGTLTGNATVTSALPIATGNGVASLTISSSATSIPADGSTTATITVLAKNSSNVAASGVSVALSASAGTLSGATTTTNSSGDVTATLSGLGATAGSTITLTATSGTAKNTFTVSVIATQQTLTILTSSPTMPSNNSAPVTISVIVQNASNQLVPGVAVSFQASSGAIAPVATTAGAAASPVVAAGTTDANGVAQATLSTPGNPQNRTITVTVTAGSSTGTIQIPVGGTKLAVSGPASLVVGAAGSYSVSLTDSGGAGISGQTVALTSALGNTFAPGSVTTGSTGTATFSMTAVNSGSDTITATWQSVTATQGVSISNQNFTITVGSPTVVVTTTATPSSTPVTLSWTAAGVGQNGTVNLSTSRGTVTPSTVTVSNGVISPSTVTVALSSTTAGPAIISATALNGGQTVATTQTSVTFIATVPNTLAVQANPSTVPVLGQSTITATVTDVNNNPVQGVQVSFTLTDSTGGSLSTDTAYTTAQGQATVTYTASSTTSTPGGVVVAVTLPAYGSVAGTSTNLTVGGQATSLKLGTGLTISQNSPANTQFILPYTVTAYDASGVGVSGVNVSFTVTSYAYGAGIFKYVSGAWTQFQSAPQAGDPLETAPIQGVPGCTPESVYELNGVIETGNTTLTTTIPSNWVYTGIPGDVAAVSQSPVATAAGGSATINLTYPQNYATWVAVSLTATAIVQGTQNSTTTTFWLPGLDTDITEQTPPPPFAISPFGTVTSCYANQPAP